MNRVFFAVAMFFLVTACAQAPSQTGSVSVNAPSTAEFPRNIETANGTVTLAREPLRIHALSTGVEEITLALVKPERMAAVSTFLLDPAFSNSVEVASKVPVRVTRDVEQIIAANPDVVVASTTTRKELVDRLQAAGVPVLIPPHDETVENLTTQIRWLGRIYGADDQANRLVQDVERRLARVDAAVSKTPAAQRPKGMLISGSNYTAGNGASRDALIRRGGLRNIAAENGIEGYKVVNLESLVSWAPEVIISEDLPTNPTLTNQLKTNPALSEVPAIKKKKVFIVQGSLLSTLSHYQVRGVEEVARQLFPAEFAGVTFEEFAKP